MSVKHKLRKDSGHLGTLITSSADNLSAEHYTWRFNALLRVIRSQDAELVDWESVREVLDILADMAPTVDQADKMFDRSN